MSVELVSCGNHLGFKEGDTIGTLADNGQLILNVAYDCAVDDNRATEATIVRFALLPDDFVVRTTSDNHISIGQLRKGLRKTNANPHNWPIVGLPGHWPNIHDGHGLLPLSIEKAANVWLLHLLVQQRTRTIGWKSFKLTTLKWTSGGSLERYTYTACFEIVLHDDKTIKCSVIMKKTAAEWDAYEAIFHLPDGTDENWHNFHTYWEKI